MEVIKPTMMNVCLIMCRVKCYVYLATQRAVKREPRCSKALFWSSLKKKKHLKFTPLKKKIATHTDRWEGAGIGGTLSLYTWTGTRVFNAS